MSHKFLDLHQQRLALRQRILEDFKKEPTMEKSELLRKIDGDILFWQSQTNTSVEGLLKTLSDSFTELENWL